MMVDHNRKLLNCLDDHLVSDIVRFKLVKVKKEDNSKEFFDYLVSVATRSIGLRASIKPFNENQEHLLAYIVDIFSIGKSYKSSTSQLSIDTLKRHSWRPELRIRVQNPPRSKVDNLWVRIYLFKEVSTEEKSMVFGRSRLDSTTLIRPINELRGLLKFRLRDQQEDAPTRLNQYQMIQVTTSDNFITSDDLKLNLRRYYCENRSAHILRFEFWQKTSDHKLACLSWMRTMIRKLVYDGCFAKYETGNYMNIVQELYGYINIKLTELPSYATKQTYPILSLHGDRKLNNCEICLELRNRRISDEDDKNIEHKAIPEAPRKTREKFLINHMRLYANCILYQFQSLTLKHNLSFDQIRNVTIENLFYIPAYTLINQHRLQSNLNQSEDKYLRRVAILRLLIRSVEFANSSNQSSIKLLQSMLISILQNEYTLANGVVDDKTMHEINPFSDDVSKNIIDLELVCLEDIVDSFLKHQLQKHFIVDEIDLNIDNSITTSTLKMFKLACQRNRNRVDALESTVDNVLCDLVVEHIQQNISKRLRDEDKSPKLRSKSWLKLLDQLDSIDHNIRLYWNSRGLRKLIGDQYRTGGEPDKLKPMIKVRLDNYLKM